MLRQYQFDFGVRSATMYTRPGLSVDTNGAQVDLTYGLAPTQAGDGAYAPAGFSYLNSANPISSRMRPGPA